MDKNLDKNFLQWAKANEAKALIPNGLLEPRASREGVGAALVVRAALYFERAYAPSVKGEIAECFAAFLKAAGVDAKFTFVWHNGKAAQAYAKAEPLAALAAKLGPDARFDFDYLSGEKATDASLYEFHATGLREWQEKMGSRGVNSLSFSWPLAAVQANPDAFAELFVLVARKLEALHGQAGYAVNLAPTTAHENEATEYWIAQMMPGLDVGSPEANPVRDLKGQIKTVNWLTALGASMLEAVGGVKALRRELPPSWFGIENYGAGVVIRAGVEPDSGASESEEKPPTLPAAYVILDHALRAVRAPTLDALQRGTVGGGAPVYNTRASTEQWLRRFEVSDDELLRAKAALLDTPPLAEADGSSDAP